jgi:hypothetical protein
MRLMKSKENFYLIRIQSYSRLDHNQVNGDSSLKEQEEKTESNIILLESILKRKLCTIISSQLVLNTQTLMSNHLKN